MNTPTLIATATSILAHRATLALGLRTRRDGWRRAAAIVLRREPGAFILSAFGLNAAPPATSNGNASVDALRNLIAQRLAAFLQSQPLCHIRVARSEHEDMLEPCQGPAHTLAFENWIDGPARFLPPKHWRHHAERPSTLGPNHDPFFDVLCRANDQGSCDLWFRFNHAATDGVPAQDLVSRLEQAWGTREQVLFPSPEEFIPFAIPRPSPGREGLAELHTFVDLSGLLAWRKRVNATLPQPLTVSAALSWHLAAHAHFAHHQIASTVEVAPTHALPAGVGLVIVKPADYINAPNGLARFARDFNTQIERNRIRASSGCTILDAAAFLSPKRESQLLLHALATSPKAFGSLGLTILKDAKVFGAPIGAAGHDHGFLALGSAALPTRDGRRVACLSVKGLATHIANYPALLREALPAA